MKISVKALVVAGVLSAAAIAGVAQARMGMDEHHGMSMGEGHSRMSPERMEKMMARHLETLKAKLKITATQEGAWKTFTEAMKPSGNMMGNRPDMAAMKDLPTPERLDKMRAMHKQMMAEREASMEKRDAAIKTFYAGLTADQKKVFDAEHANMGSHGKGSHDGKGGPKGEPQKGPKAKPEAPAKQ